MLTKFENKSNRVKGLAFHPKRPWILASLHNGVIQLWDYRMEALVDKFEEHDGPVRGVHFHCTQPLFVSGGDDYKIRVWNYTLRRCLFTLTGHLDYIRTVKFHHEYPWIVSASDDQTIRIWNWQSRACLSVLTGHNHYVMCAQFHPTDDLVLSASLDQTCRVWDISGLRKKNVSITEGGMQQNTRTDMFGSSDVVVTHVAEGHTRGVNWASFHDTMPLIVSGADDREVKLWRYNESKIWEVDTMRGHTSNVSCVIFHPKYDFIISNSEDKSIRIWDISKQLGPQTFRRENDRYWILACHPKLNLFAAGHDNGMIVFKLERERPAFDVHKQLFYYKDHQIRQYEFRTTRDTPAISTRRHGNFGGSSTLPRTLIYNSTNPKEHNILLFSDADGGTYELYNFQQSRGDLGSADDGQSALRGLGKSGAFVSRNRFAVLDRNRQQISLKNLKNETKRKVRVPNSSVNLIFPADIGKLLLRCTDRMILFDVVARKALKELQTQARHPVKYVFWSEKHTHCAMLSKFQIHITDGNLNDLCTVHETSRVKSGAWDPSGVFIYTTQNHIKYCLTNGDNGIVRTLEVPVYLTSVAGTSLHCLDREWKCRVMTIDNTEYMFKLALESRDYKQVIKIIKSNKLVGESIIAYLQRKGFPEVALHFVQDTKTKFSLSLECGNIKVAYECAVILNNDECWHRLGVEALRQGNQQVVEMAYQKTKNFERLSFLYLITGNHDKLKKMQIIAKHRDDPMGRFQNALFLGDTESTCELLKDVGQLQLSYMNAVAHNLIDKADEVAELLDGETPELPDLSNSVYLSPPPPILRDDDNWPLLQVKGGYFKDSDAFKRSEEEEPLSPTSPLSMEPDFGDDLKDDYEEPDELWGDIGSGDKEEETEDLLDLGELGIEEDGLTDLAPDGTEEKVDDYMPNAGFSFRQNWLENSSAVSDIIASGSFDLAMESLHRQHGIVNFSHLRPWFMAIYNAAIVQVQLLPGVDPIEAPLLREAGSKKLPMLGLSFSHCADRKKMALKAVGRAIDRATEGFQQILHILPLLTIESRSAMKETTELVTLCKEYLTGLRAQTMIEEHEDDPVRQMELALYYTRCNLQPDHIYVGLIDALKIGMKIKNFKTTGIICRRMLELNLSANLPQNLQKFTKKVKAVLQKCEQNETDEHELNFNPREALILCCESLQPVERGQSVKCPYCEAHFSAEFNNQICSICNICKIGGEAEGFKVQESEKGW